MTLRSYWIAGSLLVACAAPKDKAEAVEAVVHAEDPKPEESARKAKIELGGSDDPLGTSTGEPDTGEPDLGGGGAVVIVVPAADPPKTKKRKKPKSSSCSGSYVKFDGKCLPKKKADYLAEKRDEKHLAELAAAEDELEQSKVQQQIIEDQAEQMGKYEDDLDEILEKLEDKKKKGEGPFDKKGGDPFDG